MKPVLQERRQQQAKNRNRQWAKKNDQEKQPTTGRVVSQANAL